MRVPLCCLPLALVALLLAPPAARGDAVAEFYKGKQLRVIIRANPGGNYDTYLRLFARHFVRHVPGQPTALPMNMPGAGGLTALSYFDKVAPRDGTTITMVTQTAPLDQALGRDAAVKIDMRALGWIGNVSQEPLFLITRRSSATKSLQDARGRETLLAATGEGGVEVLLVAALNHVAGTRFRNIIGYRSGPEMNLAMARGEAEGRATTNLRAQFAAPSPEPGLIGADAYNVLIQTGLKAHKDYPKVPLLSDAALTPGNRLVLEFLSKVTALARPIATSDNVPAERLAALRQAFDSTIKDPEFLDDARKQDLDVSPMSGVDLAGAVRDIVEAPANVIDEVRKAIDAGASAQQQRPAAASKGK